MTTPAKPKKPATAPRRKRTAASKPAATPRKRSVEKQATGPETVPARSSDNGHGSPDRHQSSRQLEQFAVLALAFAFGLTGFAVHVLWFVAVVLMAVLLGLSAAELRGHRRRGVISEVVTEVKNVAEDLTSREQPELQLSSDDS